MCGIAGIVGDNLLQKKTIVKKMTDAIAHRGPDGEAMWGNDNCILGHRRLSIIDLATGDQPMLSHDGKKVLIFNGEIYGYKKIKDSLNQYRYKTTSDTEVIFPLHEKYGENLAEHLPGMFAFALWNEDTQELLCGRDRFGEKPFYYALTSEGNFIFASEIKAIVASSLIKPELNNESLVHYLQHLYVHPGKTIYKNIFTLPPAHYLTFRKGVLRVNRYWYLPKTNDSFSINEATETFKFLFEKAVQKQLIADVPVGAFLSGGMDSSLTVAVAAKYKANIKTISFGFGNEINELPYAKEVADKYNTDHVEIQQPLPNLADLMIKMQEVFDEPFADSSNIPTYLISKAASQHLKVVLTGDGGDELLGGYSFWYRHLFNIEKADSFNGYKKVLLPYAARLARKLGNSYFPYLQQQQLSLSKGKQTVQGIHAQQNIYFNTLQLRQLGFSNADNSFTNYSFDYEHTVSDAMKMDIENYMPGDILVKTDRAAMANSLELRAPFLDVDLASFCISLPYKLKLNYKEEKIIAKQALGSMLPASIIKRQKQGFGAPVTSWLKSPALQQLKNEYLHKSNKKLFDLVDYKQTQKVVAEDNYHTWILLVLSLWMETH